MTALTGWESVPHSLPKPWQNVRQAENLCGSPVLLKNSKFKPAVVVTLVIVTLGIPAASIVRNLEYLLIITLGIPAVIVTLGIPDVSLGIPWNTCSDHYSSRWNT